MRRRFPEGACRGIAPSGKHIARELHIDLAHPAAVGVIGMTILIAVEKQANAISAMLVHDEGQQSARGSARVNYSGHHRLRSW